MERSSRCGWGPTESHNNRFDTSQVVLLLGESKLLDMKVSKKSGRKAMGRVLRYANQTYSSLMRHSSTCITLKHPLFHR